MFAFGVIALNSIDSTVSVSHFLFGQLLTVTINDVYITLVLTVLALLFVWWRFPDLTFSTFDRDHATQIGIRVQRLDGAMLVLLAVCVVVCLNTVGIALTVSLLITPTPLRGCSSTTLAPLPEQLLPSDSPKYSAAL